MRTKTIKVNGFDLPIDTDSRTYKSLQNLILEAQENAELEKREGVRKKIEAIIKAATDAGKLTGDDIEELSGYTLMLHFEGRRRVHKPDEFVKTERVSVKKFVKNGDPKNGASS